MNDRFFITEDDATRPIKTDKKLSVEAWAVVDGKKFVRDSWNSRLPLLLSSKRDAESNRMFKRERVIRVLITEVEQ